MNPILAIGAAVGLGKLVNDHLAFMAAAQPYRAAIRAAAVKYGLSESVLAGLFWKETRFNPKAVGKAGEIGIGQIMESAWTDLKRLRGFTGERSQLFDPVTGINAAAAFLSLQRERTGDLFTAIRAYNVGAGKAKTDPTAGFGYLTDVLVSSVVDTLYTSLNGSGAASV